MTGALPLLATAASGVRAANEWMNATGDNIANVNTVLPAGQEPFRAHRVVAAPDPERGVQIVAHTRDQSEPDRVHDPGNALADEDGYITRPVVDLTQEMTNMVVAQRMFQINLSVHGAGMEAYRAALKIGQGQ